MPMGFRRFRYLNESATPITSGSYKAYGDPYAEPASEILDQSYTTAVAQNAFHAFAVPGGPGGLPGVFAVKVTLKAGNGNKDPRIENWILGSAYEDYTLEQVQVVVSMDPSGVLVAQALLIIDDDTYEERTRYFLTPP